MITLQSIRIRNFRSVGEATFKPLQKGITGLVGANGAGKTTFLSATVWALYGVRPPDATLPSLRREGSTGECSVSVVFSHLGQQVEIIRELKGKNNRIIVNIYVDGVEQTVTSVGAADTWITKRLGISSEGFLTAFVVRQKELDELITARPADRKAIIEKLAGIETINAALKASREDENSAKKILSGTSGSLEQVESIENQMNLLTDKLDQMSADRESLYTQQQDRTKKQRSLQSELNALQEFELAYNDSALRIENADREISSILSQLERLSYLADLSQEDDSTLLEDLRQRHRDTKAESTQLQQDKASATNLIDLYESTRTSKNNILKQVDVELKNLPPVDSTADELTSKTSLLKQQELELNDTRSKFVSRIGDLTSSIELLGHSDECPTCHSTLDEPHKLVANFKATIEEYRRELHSATVIASENKREQKEIETLLNVLTRKEELTNTQNEAQASKNEAEEALPAQQEHVKKITEKLAETEEALTKIAELGVKAKTVYEDRAALETLTAQKTAIEDQRKKFLQIRIESEKSLKGDKVSKLKTNLLAVEQEIDENAPLLETSTNERSRVEYALISTKNNYKQASEAWARRKELLARQEQLSLTTSLLAKFRANTISALAPELSEYATGMISDMTNGEFIEVLLDDDFDASVITKDGLTRPVAWLSGGELSAVALALRIAIGYLLAGGNSQLLWLDEVLTAQDADRRSSMLSLIRSLPIDQIIMVNHSEGAADILDKTINLSKNLEIGSYIDEVEDE